MPLDETASLSLDETASLSPHPPTPRHMMTWQVWAMPLQEMARNPHLITAITRHGGHMGYTAGLSPLAHTWTDRLLVHYLRALHARDGIASGVEAGGAADK